MSITDDYVRNIEDPKTLYHKSLERFIINSNQNLGKVVLLLLLLEFLTIGAIYWTFDANIRIIILTAAQGTILSIIMLVFVFYSGKFRFSPVLQRYNDFILVLILYVFYFLKIEVFISLQSTGFVHLAGGFTLLQVILFAEKGIVRLRVKLSLLILCILYISVRALASEQRNSVTILQSFSTGLVAFYCLIHRDSINQTLFIQNSFLLRREINSWQKVLKDFPDSIYLLDCDLRTLFTNIPSWETEKNSIFMDFNEKRTNQTHDETIRKEEKINETFKLIQDIEVNENDDLAYQFFASVSSTGTTSLDDSFGGLLVDGVCQTKPRSPRSTIYALNNMNYGPKNESETLGNVTAKRTSRKFKNWLQAQSLHQILSLISKNMKKFKEIYGKSQIILHGKVFEDSSPMYTLANFTKVARKESHESKAVEIKISFSHFQRQDCLFITLINKTQLVPPSSLKNVNEYKINLLASFSHELRTPLNGNLNFLEAAIQRPDLSDEIKNEYIFPALTSAKLLFYIISDILDYSQFSLDKISLSVKRFKIRDLFEQIVELFKVQANKKNLKITLDLPENYEVATDFTRLSQILVNLVSNALKFTYEGGIHIGISKVNEPPNCYKIFVTDTGIGISHTQKRKIEKILKGEDTEKVGNESVGSNLGLSTSSRLAILLGPAKESGITLEKEKKGGTKASFLIENKKLSYNDRSLIDLSLSGLIVGSPQPRLIDDALNNLGRRSHTFFSFYEPGDEIKSQIALKRCASSNGDAVRDLKHRINNDSQFIMMTTPEEGKAEYVEQYSVTGGMTKMKVDIQLPQPILAHTLSKRIPTKRSTLKDNLRCKCNSILIVDDDSFNVMAAEKLFGSAGITCVSAFHGKQAIEIIEARKPCSEICQLFRFILMDCNMPVMDGYDTSQYLKQRMNNGDLPFIPIIGCTAFVTHFDAAKCFDSGMDDYVPKPLSKEKISRILEKWERIKPVTQVLSPGLAKS